MLKILNYLSALKENNNRDWYQAHKKEFQSANAEFLDLIQSLILEIGKTDPSILFNIPRELTFKLNRDTRFSKDKSPYNPAFRAHISAKGKLPIPVGYYIVIRPDNGSFLGGGLFADMFKEATAMIRDHIAEHGLQWQEIITAPSFTSFFEVRGTALKKVPQGYDPSHPQGEYLKYKSWYLEYPLSDEQLLKADFAQKAAKLFAAMQPFNTFLNEALTGFEMPKRS